jgi:hypothetical protein
MYNGAMPPSQSNTPEPLLPPAKKAEPIGPVVGIIIIILVLALGGLYFWGRELNKQHTEEPLPFIPGDISKTTDA